MKPSFECTDNSAQPNCNCACTCSNGLLFNRTLSAVPTSGSLPGSDTCNVDRDECLQREEDYKNSLAAQSTLINQMTADLDNEKQTHSVDMETLQSQCNAQEQTCTTRQNELEAQLKTTQQALEAARNNQTAIIQEWNSKPFAWHGCYQDSTKRVLSDVYVKDDQMDTGKCSRICYGYRYYGVEAGKECWCGNNMNGNPARYVWTQCNTQCPGNKALYCGAAMKIGIYAKAA